MRNSRLAAIGEAQEVPLLTDVEEAPPAPPKPRAESALTSLLITSLRALSQRTIVALSSLVDLALLASAFALWLMIVAEPTPLQLGCVGGYAVFVVVALWRGRDREMPPVSDRQRKYMAMDLARARRGQRTKTGMSESQLREFARKPSRSKRRSRRG